jgi:hypothetical protein
VCSPTVEPPAHNITNKPADEAGKGKLKNKTPNAHPLPLTLCLAAAKTFSGPARQTIIQFFQEILNRPPAKSASKDVLRPLCEGELPRAFRACEFHVTHSPTLTEGEAASIAR